MTLVWIGLGITTTKGVGTRIKYAAHGTSPCSVLFDPVQRGGIN